MAEFPESEGSDCCIEPLFILCMYFIELLKHGSYYTDNSDFWSRLNLDYSD